jgi:hypothetical protein
MNGLITKSIQQLILLLEVVLNWSQRLKGLLPKGWMIGWMAIVTIMVALIMVRGIAADQPNEGGNSQSKTKLLPVPVPLLIGYQGRLADPSTGQAKANGNYSVVFSLYDVDSGGVPLWSESKTVSVVNGVFSTNLGDITPLDIGLFNGQALWLGIKVETDAEATPRQLITVVPYAIHAEDAATVGGQQPTDFAAASHTHSGTDITSGTVSEARVDAAVARDSEIMPIILTNDGSGSGLDADLLDGQHASAFATVDHNHDSRYYVRNFGTQFTSTLNLGETQNWFTYDWSPNELVIWSVRPTTSGGRISWSVEIERQSNDLLTYWININNVGASTTSIEAKYYTFSE